MKLYWLRNTRQCTLELPLVDYSGQRLVFHRPGKPFERRCVREDVLNHELIQARLATQILVVEDSEGGVASLPIAAPTLMAESAAEEAPAHFEPEPAPQPEPEPEPDSESDSEPDAEAGTEEEESGDDSVSAESPSSSKRRRRRRSS